MTTTTSSSVPVALVTGGTTGIGLATARVLHKRGYAVLVTGRNPDTLAAAKHALPDDVVVFRADARSIADADAVAAELRHRFGKLDLAFLNAGVTRLVPLEALDEETYDWYFDINLKGQVFTLQKVLPLLGQGSSIVFTSSTVSDRAQPGMAAYAATKGAQLSLMRTLAVELAPRGVRVNAVSPGPIETPIITKLDLPADVLDGFKDTFTARVPIGRFGAAEEIGNAVAFLASAEASFITGANLVVDGGITIG
jgi:NAD(P)-dependent dehydrogenase (short-subunit alcohol dehydrogenase family)